MKEASMAMIAVQVKVDGERVVQALEEAREKMDSGEGGLVLDFSSVSRIDAQALRAMEALAAGAEGKGVKLTLRGTRADVYKVLKLMKLTPRFLFLT
jgi:anti-anti-sigma regulatory factor